MKRLMEEVGGDGFLVSPPALRRRGLIRDGYSCETFRENLLEFF